MQPLPRAGRGRDDDLRRPRAEIDRLPAELPLVEREAPAEQIQLRLERDILAILAHRLGDRRVAR